MSKEEEARGPWNEGSSTQLKEEWQYIDKPQEYVTSTDGLTNVTPKGTDRTEEMVKEKDEKLAKEENDSFQNSGKGYAVEPLSA